MEASLDKNVFNFTINNKESIEEEISPGSVERKKRR